MSDLHETTVHESTTPETVVQDDASKQKRGRKAKVATDGNGTAAPRSRPWLGLKDSDRIYVVSDHEKPRREGTKAAEHFELYRNGMTIGEAKAENIMASRLKTDVNKGRIVIEEAPENDG